MTVVTLEEFQAERHKATDLVVTAKRFTQTHHSLVMACADFADGPVWIAPFGSLTDEVSAPPKLPKRGRRPSGKHPA